MKQIIIACLVVCAIPFIAIPLVNAWLQTSSPTESGSPQGEFALKPGLWEFASLSSSSASETSPRRSCVTAEDMGPTLETAVKHMFRIDSNCKTERFSSGNDHFDLDLVCSTGDGDITGIELRSRGSYSAEKVTIQTDAPQFGQNDTGTARYVGECKALVELPADY